MTNKMKSKRNLLVSAVSKLVTIAFGLILPRLFLVNYGSEVNGLLNSLNQLITCLALFEAGIGAASLQVLYGPIATGKWDRVNGILSATSRYYKRMGRWYMVILLICAFVYPLVTKSELPYGVVCGAVFFSGMGSELMFFVTGKYAVLLQADGKIYILSVLAILNCIGMNVAKIVLIALGANIVVILAAGFCVSMIQTILVVCYVKKTYPVLDLGAEADHAALAQKNYALAHEISGMIFQNTDILILTVVCGLKVVSVYAMFKMIISHLEGILHIIPDSLKFSLGQLFQVDRERFIKRIDLYESFYSALCYAVFSVTLFLLLPFLELYTAGVDDINYLDGKLAVLFVVIVLMSESRKPMLMAIDFAGHFKKTVSRTITESAINLTVSLIAVNLLGIYGVLIGTVVALLYRTNDIIIYSNTKILKRSPWKTYSIYLVNVVLFIGLQFLFPILLKKPESYFQFIVVGIVATIIAVIVFGVGQIISQRNVGVFVLEQGKKRHILSR